MKLEGIYSELAEGQAQNLANLLFSSHLGRTVALSCQPGRKLPDLHDVLNLHALKEKLDVMLAQPARS